MPEVIFNKDNIVKIDNKKIQSLKKEAFNNPSKKVRLCLHKNVMDPLHEMIIVQKKEVYVRPHKHKFKTESFHVIEGSFIVVIFDNEGKVVSKIIMGNKRGNNLLCRLGENIWHMIIPISDFVIFHEITNGPYKKKEHSIFAPWAPDGKNEAEVKRYIDLILKTERRE